MRVQPQSAAPPLELKPDRDPRMTNRAGMPLEAHFRETAA
jgi:hypothetical protein